MSTGARVGGVRPPGIPRESWLRRKTIKSEAARRVREVTDNRANEPTPEQVEAAAKAIWERSAKIDDPFWDGGALDYGIKQIYRADARAALEASNAVVTKEAHDVGMDAVDWDMVRDGVGDPQEAASIAVRAALEAYRQERKEQ